MKSIVFVVLVSLSSTLLAQGLTETFDEECSCFVITNHYENGQISSVHHENVNRNRVGAEKVYSAGGNLNYERNWEKGKLHGSGTFYHPDGIVYINEQYVEGQKVGKWNFQDPQGTPIQTIEYTGHGNDGTYSHFYTGQLYFVQKLENGALVNSEVVNQELYDIVQEEGSATTK